LPPYIWPNPLSASTTYTTGTNLSDYINTNTGAFTFEVMVRPMVNPLTAGKNMEIIAGDSGFPFRAWQFRISSAGKLEFNININAPTGWFHDIVVPLPATGPDAVAVGNWYHVAVTCTGNAPTNGDASAQVKLYWTLMDMTRTNADVLWVTNITYGTFTNTAVPLIAIGGSGRGSPISNVGNSEGFIGNIDEVRISSVCRKSTEMLFDTNVAFVPIGLNIPQTTYLIGYGQTLQIVATETGTQPVTNQWYQNGVALPGQTNTALIINNVTFAANGNYQLQATNAAGSAVGAVCTVNVGAALNGVFNTGVDANGNALYLTAPGSVDSHYQLIQSSDPNNPGPNAIIWGGTPNGGAPSSSASGWIGPRNGNGAPNGTYSYQTTFQIDNADVASSVLSGNMLAGGPSANVVQAFLNGVETDITLAPNTISTTAPFVITNGLQAGSNTLVFNLADSSGNFPGLFRVELTGIGNALPSGLPTFNSQPPASQTVTYGAPVVLPVVALGRPPLSYQWLSNGIAISPSVISSATNQYLTFVATNIDSSQLVGGSFTANYQVVVSNDSGSVTSSVDALTIQIPPPAVVSAGEPIWNPTNSQTNIVVIFSESMDPTTAATTGNYLLDNGANVLGATLVSSNEAVLATSVLAPGTPYTLTVQNVQGSFLNIPMSPSPTNLVVGTYPLCALWIRANTGVSTNSDGTVNQWNDLSGNGNNLFLASATPPVLAASALGQPVVRFDGTNNTQMFAFDSASLRITGDLSLFAVMNFATLDGGTNGMIVCKDHGSQPAPYDYYAFSTNTVRLLRGNGSTSATVNSSSGPSLGATHLLDAVMRGSNVTHRLDGANNGSGTLSSTIADTGDFLFIGSRGNNSVKLTGDMTELILASSTLSASDVTSMENYLATEYSLHLAPPVNPNPTNIVISSASGNQINLSWPLDHTGWQLQSNSVSLTATGAWFNVPGSTGTNQTIITPNATRTNVFYRLLYQP
jgi:hypothetical protein